MKVYASRSWHEGTLIPKQQRRPTPGAFELLTIEGTRVAYLRSWHRVDTHNPDLFPPLFDATVIHAAKQLMKIRGWERPIATQLFFQEWLVDLNEHK